MSKSVLVTGGAGYVGSHCCRAFADAGWRVSVFDNLSRGWRDFVRWGSLIEGDLLDRSSIQTALEVVKPDAVAHFAAFAYVGESVSNPAIYYANNVTGTLNLLEGMRATGVDKIVFSSTCATYGVPTQVPIDETHPQHPINPYGRSKLMVERILADYAAAHGIAHVALRYFNAAGADPSGEFGERHEPETHVIPLAIVAAMRGDDSFQIFGDDFDTRDGTAVRDYIHVADLADAHLKALAYLQYGGASDVFNLGTGSGYSVREVIDTVKSVSGVDFRVDEAPRRAGDPASITATGEKVRAVLGWQPKHDDLNEIVRTAYEWEQHLIRRNR